MFVLCRCAKRELMKLVAFGSKRRSDFAQSLCLHVRVTNLTTGSTGRRDVCRRGMPHGGCEMRENKDAVSARSGE